MTTLTTSPSTEDLAYATIRSGRAFARLWLDTSIDTRGSTRSLWPATCRRLAEGQPFEARDIDVVTLMGEALRVALNTQRAGYGDHALCEDTSHDDLWDPRLEELRRLTEVYKHFRDCQERYADRVTAEREVARVP
ncbi:hypothetical protein [Limimaricola cinnabarinus]|uniref:Uncharacterized protein n=1 Tax=Limimaricola cinnabarinus LL-001 TaxID=1337093 RepID=U2YP89_9RHOB|nr:hypothetical protein [Limimaricola cinnabarinus]GAD57196.1 hypothetical protein MBELCI_3248 [Limimaricola cinnabarinus LL-001]